MLTRKGLKLPLVFLSMLILTACSAQEEKLKPSSWNDLKEDNLKGNVKSVKRYLLSQHHSWDVPDSVTNDSAFLYRIMEYDANGCLTRMTRYGINEKDGNKIRETKEEYFSEIENGLLVKSGLKREGDWCNYKTYQYNSSGILEKIKVSYCNIDTLKRRVVTEEWYEFDAADNLSKKTIVSSLKGVRDTAVEFYDKGVLVKVSDQTGSTYDFKITKDSSGRLTEVTATYSHKNGESETNTVKYTKFDHHGNWIESEETSSNSWHPEDKNIITRVILYY